MCAQTKLMQSGMATTSGLSPGDIDRLGDNFHYRTQIFENYPGVVQALVPMAMDRLSAAPTK